MDVEAAFVMKCIFVYMNILFTLTLLNLIVVIKHADSNKLKIIIISVWMVLDGCPIGNDQQADIDKLMSASGIAVNQLVHIQMRSLASNATV